jgi:hypothetical protein
MARYLILFNSEKSAKEIQAQATPEQVKASMGRWIAWKNEAVKTVKFEFGLPLQAVARITPDEIIESPNPAGGHAFIEGDETEVKKLLQTHPHLLMEGTSIDLLEMLPLERM